MTGKMVMDYVEINLSLDGDQWCALIGDNLQNGVAGFSAENPVEAIRALCDELYSSPVNCKLGNITLG